MTRPLPANRVVILKLFAVVRLLSYRVAVSAPFAIIVADWITPLESIEYGFDGSMPGKDAGAPGELFSPLPPENHALFEYVKLSSSSRIKNQLRLLVISSFQRHSAPSVAPLVLILSRMSLK